MSTNARKKRIGFFRRKHNVSNIFWPDLCYSTSKIIMNKNDIVLVAKDINLQNTLELQMVEKFSARIRYLLVKDSKIIKTTK